MGLDISVYRKLTPASGDVEMEDGYPVDYDTYWLPGPSMKWSEKTFPGRGKGIDPSTVYTFSEKSGFPAGSYGGYNHWRNLLAEMAGYGSAEEAWDNQDKSAPFMELIDFADNEGVIGPIVSAKLAKDFSEFESKAEKFSASLDQYESKKFIHGYRVWKAAFEMASDGGAVEFR
jgi:hypothetical protein